MPSMIRGSATCHLKPSLNFKLKPLAISSKELVHVATPNGGLHVATASGGPVHVAIAGASDSDVNPKHILNTITQRFLQFKENTAVRDFDLH